LLDTFLAHQAQDFIHNTGDGSASFAATGIGHSNTVPSPTAAELRVRLVRCDLQASNAYVITKTFHDGDIIFDIGMP
jgi:hypothetical protein